ncbi:MAG: hypothetical protein KatS3mg111_3060 [Pirellulaceae bacterium]|nr:MAG: hypothetical protein KatS3mg111_3060 [Pirellulaceae bacterium]
MRDAPRNSRTKAVARKLRRQATPAETLLWAYLRNEQLCGLRFRRQHPVDRFFADFACVGRKLIIELDGDYHDNTIENDVCRQAVLEGLGWKVLRFHNSDVLENVDAVGHAIAAHLGLDYSYHRRAPRPSGIRVKRKDK